MRRGRRPARPSPSRYKTPPPGPRRRAPSAVRHHSPNRPGLGRRLRRLGPKFVLAVGVLAVAFGIWVATRPEPPSVFAETPAASYRVVYRIRQRHVPERSEERIVRRPYDGVSVMRDRAGAILSGQLHNDVGVFQYQRGGDVSGWRKLLDKRHGPVSDFRALPAIRDQVRHGHARMLGYRSVLGRRCALVRIGGPLGDVDAFQKPTAREHVDTCLDRSGIALFEHWTSSGTLVRRTDATLFDSAYAPTATTFVPSPRIADPAPGALGQVGLDVSDSTRRSFGALVAPFDGFREDGGVLDVSLGGGGATGATATLRWRRGIDVIELSTTPTRPPTRAGDRTVTTRRWGPVTFHPDTFRSSYEVRVNRDQWAVLKAADLRVLAGALEHLERTRASARQ